MTTIRIPMIEVEKCLICGKDIGKGNDPALCEKERCHNIFKYEIAFNKFSKDESEG